MGNPRKRLKSLDSDEWIETFGNLDFVAPGLDFVAPGLDFIALGLDFVAPGFDSVFATEATPR